MWETLFTQEKLSTETVVDWPKVTQLLCMFSIYFCFFSTSRRHDCWVLSPSQRWGPNPSPQRFNLLPLLRAGFINQAWAPLDRFAANHLLPDPRWLPLGGGAKWSSWALASEGPQRQGGEHLLASAPVSCLPAARTHRHELL